jgi:hypothetical protein
MHEENEKCAGVMMRTRDGGLNLHCAHPHSMRMRAMAMYLELMHE